MERCLFVDYPFYEDFFEPDLDFSWARHKERLLAAGHDTREEANFPTRIDSTNTATKKQIGDLWLFKNLTEEFQHDYGIELWKDYDWTVALLQSNPFHKVRLASSQSQQHRKIRAMRGLKCSDQSVTNAHRLSLRVQRFSLASRRDFWIQETIQWGFVGLVSAFFFVSGGLWAL